jgi:predicted butyrate kinase (DUF1464 family)
LVRALGTDSGTKSYDIFGFDDETGEVFADEAIPREEMVKDPGLILRRLKEIDRDHGLDAIVASSGYGIPLKLAKDVSDEEIALATFITENDVRRGLRIIGLRKLLKMLKEDPELGSKTYFTPGVIQLPTVPDYRKINKIDMGTSDKVYTAALAIARHAELRGIDYGDVSIIVVEVGFAYTSALGIRKGRIVDAMAGTAGFPGFLGMGCMDGELVYALANSTEISKELLFKGGAAYLSNFDPFRASIDEFIKPGTPGYELLVEAIVKDILSLLCSVKPEAVYLSGRFLRIPLFARDLERRLADLFENFGWKVEIAVLGSMGKVAKQAAEGAALMANGLAGGKYRKLIDVLGLKESKGSIFEYVTVVDKNRLLEKFGRYMES